VSKRKGGSGNGGGPLPRIKPGEPLPSIQECWTAYADRVLPADAGVVQRYETTKAFYAGFWSMLSICIRLGEPDVSEADGMATLERLRVEGETWIRDRIAEEGG
jgi:hypothetical protein